MSKTWGGICTGLAIPTLQPLLTTLAYTLFGPITFFLLSFPVIKLPTYPTTIKYAECARKLWTVNIRVVSAFQALTAQ